MITERQDHLLEQVLGNQPASIKLDDILKCECPRTHAKGYAQEEGVDFEESICTSCSHGSSSDFCAPQHTRSFSNLSDGHENWHFLMVSLKEEDSVAPHPRMGSFDPNHPEKVYLLLKSYVWIKQAPRACTSGGIQFFGEKLVRRMSKDNTTALQCLQPEASIPWRYLHKVVRLGINPMIQPEPEDLPKDNPKLEIAVLRSSQYAVSTGQNSTLLYKSRQTMVPFPSRLDNHYCEEEEEEEENYGLKFTEAYEASHINDTIPRKEKDPGSFTLPCFINNTCFDNALVNLGAGVSVMPLSTYLNLGLGELAHTKLTVELADRTVKYPKGIAKNVLVGIGKFTFPVDFIILDMPEDIKVPLILGRPFLSTARAKIDVYQRKITLRVKEERIIFKSVKPASSLIKRDYMLSLRERMELDLEARLMGETLVLNRSLDPFLEDYIELNDPNEPFNLRRNKGDDLMPTIKEGEVIEEFRTRDGDLDTGTDDYHKFHNSLMKDKMVNKGDNVVGALMNVPIFVGTFSVMTNFAVLEDIDAYHDEGMGDIIVSEPFLREVGIKTKHFKGIITLYNGDDEVTYQMVRSHTRFNNHTNVQCNKIPPLLKVKPNDAGHSKDKRSADSDDGLPLLERNFNHISLKESVSSIVS
ncbi:hypothetical protein Tco_1175356 [Tanacetum coccineum]